MLIRIDSSTGVPLWLQIANQITNHVGYGGIVVGDRLPTVRELASELRINPNTVAKAYQELERTGVVETRRGLGTFACASKLPSVSTERLIIAKSIDDLIAQAAQLHISLNDLSAVFRERVYAMEVDNRAAIDRANRTQLTEDGDESLAA